MWKQHRSKLELIRLQIGSAFLSWAEQLPTVEFGTLATLQQIQRQRRKQAGEAFDRTRPPSGATLRYTGCRLFELYGKLNFGTNSVSFSETVRMLSRTSSSFLRVHRTLVRQAGP